MREHRHIDSPRPGFFRLRLVKGGPWVPARIKHGPSRCPETGEELDRSPMWAVEIDGRIYAKPCPDPVQAGVFRVWLSGHEIDESEYRAMLARRRCDPVNAREAVDITRLPSPF